MTPSFSKTKLAIEEPSNRNDPISLTISTAMWVSLFRNSYQYIWYFPLWRYTLLGCCGMCINTLRPRQNGRHFADDTFKCIFLNESVWITIKSSLKFVPRGPINNIPALIQIMAWRRPGDKPLSEAMMVSLTTHICVTRPLWVMVFILKMPTLCITPFVLCLYSLLGHFTGDF